MVNRIIARCRAARAQARHFRGTADPCRHLCRFWRGL